MLPHLGKNSENPTCSVFFEFAELPEFYENQKDDFTPLPKFLEHPEYDFLRNLPNFLRSLPNFLRILKILKIMKPRRKPSEK